MPNTGDDAAPPEMPEGGDFGGGFGGASDVKLQYIDDAPESYANIFDSAKTKVTEADKKRLISALRSLSDYEQIEQVLDVDAVLRYFVVHQFTVNGDSYTGSMIHNYYLYEQDGRLSMIPWDYNLAFGTFGGTAAAAVNDPIDDALDDRPMKVWIFSDERYTQQYHALYAAFLETVDADALIAKAYALIAPYVERDPTKFCTTEEFEAGVQALRSFCALRKESVQGQLTGTVPATGAEQAEQADALVDAGDLQLSAMGTMDGGGAPGGPGGQNTARTDGAPGGDAAFAGQEAARTDGAPHGHGAPDGAEDPSGQNAPPAQGGPGAKTNAGE